MCDDQSTDRTMDIVREFADDYPSIRWMIIRNEVRLGVRRNFEKAIALAEGTISLLQTKMISGREINWRSCCI